MRQLCWTIAILALNTLLAPTVAHGEENAGMDQSQTFNILSKKPDIKDKVHSARWLVASSDWGVLATNRGHGKIFTNVVSYSDGVYSQTDRENSTGIPYFLLTKMDESARDLASDATASFTISEKSADIDGRCGAIDAQEPTCAKITLMGKVVPLRNREEQELAKLALFSKHPAMERWPMNHGFFVYKMEIHEIFFLNDYGGASPIKVQKYLSAKLSSDEKDPDDDDSLVRYDSEEFTAESRRRRRILRAQ